MMESDRRDASSPDRRALPQRREAGRRLTDAIQDARELLADAERDERAGERLLKIAQVARMANVSERTVWRDIRAGKLAVRYPAPRRPRVPVTSARAYAGLSVT